MIAFLLLLSLVLTMTVCISISVIMAHAQNEIIYPVPLSEYIEETGPESIFKPVMKVMFSHTS